VFDLKAIQVMVLDEADRMSIWVSSTTSVFLLRRMAEPDQRSTCCSHATLVDACQRLAYAAHEQPASLVRHRGPDKVTAAKVTQAPVYTANEDKIPLLQPACWRIWIRIAPSCSVNTKRAADKVWAVPGRQRHPARGAVPACAADPAQNLLPEIPAR